jgi:hypothetical protein
MEYWRKRGLEAMAKQGQKRLALSLQPSMRAAVSGNGPMIGARHKRIWGAGGIKAAAALLVLAGLAACSATILGSQPEPAAAPPPAPPPPSAPPIDLAGRWQLTAAAGGACFMNFGGAPGAPANADDPEAPQSVQGTIAPEGGCPGNFFTSRKWTFEHDMLIVRDFKGRPLAQLAFSGGQFEGHDASGALLTLSKRP